MIPYIARLKSRSLYRRKMSKVETLERSRILERQLPNSMDALFSFVRNSHRFGPAKR